MNRKGFSFVEAILVVAIACFLSSVFIGYSPVFLVSPDDVKNNIISKIVYEQSLGQNMPSVSGYVVESKNVLPYIEFNETEMIFLRAGGADKVIVARDNYAKKNNNKYYVSTSLTDNRLFFNQNGLPINSAGKEIKEYKIYIKEKDTNAVVKTIVGNLYTRFKED